MCTYFVVKVYLSDNGFALSKSVFVDLDEALSFIGRFACDSYYVTFETKCM